ncbi:M23 family metallopeptidase [Gracilibacillus sp. D59]|uniref:M23 family metallopeptidase n=1 Tax=Gracilibacillus sp. D59 TaxID=3457434 RepID=UPI003FCCD6EC
MATWRGYRITSDFGWRNHPIYGGRKFHTGIDLVKSHKAPIEAFVPGEVLYAGPGKSGTGLGGYGTVVFIKDHNGRGHLYAHFDSVAVRKGQRVNECDIIGYQGATGNVTGSHLHYEIRKSTSPSYGWIADRKNNCVEPTCYVDSFNVSSNSSSRKTDLVVDGYWGTRTTRALQEALGTVEDGVISDQFRNAVTEKIVSGITFGRGGSLVIRALQKKINCNADGYLGPNTVSGLQNYLNTPIDGKVSKPSLMVSELQKRLCKGTF